MAIMLLLSPLVPWCRVPTSGLFLFFRAVAWSGSLTSLLHCQVDDLHITVSSMNMSTGDILRDAVTWGSLAGSSKTGVAPQQRVMGWIGTPDDCPSLLRPLVPPPENPQMRRKDDDGGKIVAMSSFGDPLGPYDFHSALFGPSTKERFPYKHGPLRFAVVDPPDGCETSKYKVRVRGAVAVVMRGACGFADKCENVQAAGAIACVIVNSEPGTNAMMADETQSAAIRIPCFMASLGLKEDLDDIAALREANPQAAAGERASLIGRFIFEDFYGRYDSED